MNPDFLNHIVNEAFAKFGIRNTKEQDLLYTLGLNMQNVLPNLPGYTYTKDELKDFNLYKDSIAANLNNNPNLEIPFEEICDRLREEYKDEYLILNNKNQYSLDLKEEEEETSTEQKTSTEEDNVSEQDVNLPTVKEVQSSNFSDDLSEKIEEIIAARLEGLNFEDKLRDQVEKAVYDAIQKVEKTPQKEDETSDVSEEPKVEETVTESPKEPVSEQEPEKTVEQTTDESPKVSEEASTVENTDQVTEVPSEEKETTTDENKSAPDKVLDSNLKPVA